MRILAEASGLARTAAAARRSVPFTSPEWQFYRGIETSAEEMLHPEVALAAGDGGHSPCENAAFRAGYAEAHHLFTIAVTASEPPATLPLPSIENRI